MRVFGSTFALILLWIFAFDLFVSVVKPLRWFNNTGLTSINQNFLVSKLPEILNGGDNKDVLLLGSSIVLVPAVRCDDKFNGIRTRYDRWYYRNYIDEYKKADYLQDLLSKRVANKVTVCNAAVAASVISDDYLIAKKYLASGKRPKIAVLCVAPREFLDNQRSQIDKTATYSILADFSSLPDLIAQKANFTRVFDSALGMAWTLYRTRTDYKDFLCAWTSTSTGNPLTLHDAGKTTHGADPTKGKKDVGVLSETEVAYKQPPNNLFDVGGYEAMYLPINQGQFTNQKQYFARLLALLKEENIPVVVVDVPVSDRNYALLPKDTLTAYYEFLADTSKEYGASLICTKDTQKFDTVNDFEDSAHMNGQGGEKLFTAIADGIAGNPTISAAIGGRNGMTFGSVGAAREPANDAGFSAQAAGGSRAAPTRLNQRDSKPALAEHSRLH